MTDRKIAILLFNERYLQNVRNAVRILMEKSVCGEITVFSDKDCPEFNVSAGGCLCKNEKFSNYGNAVGTETAKRNSVLKKYEAENFTGILHVISDCVELQKDPSQFMADLESMMRDFDYPVWLSTVSDPCNYVYNKYNPRFSIVNDMPALHKLGIRYGLSVTSHSNTAWMAYDLNALTKQADIKYFSEDFQVPMFYIIEFLARRRQHKLSNQLFFMNQYLTVSSEYGVFKIDNNAPDDSSITTGIMQAEDKKFKDMHVNYEPDYSTNAVIDSIIEKIIAKTGECAN